jgi:hypothetical protein
VERRRAGQLGRPRGRCAARCGLARHGRERACARRARAPHARGRRRGLPRGIGGAYQDCLSIRV